MKLGAARQQAPAAWRLVEIEVAKKGAKFEFAPRKNKLREVRRQEGHYLLRSNLCATNQEKLWELYVQLTQVEEAFKNLKGDLALRPFHHQKERSD